MVSSYNENLLYRLFHKKAEEKVKLLFKQFQIETMRTKKKRTRSFRRGVHNIISTFSILLLLLSLLDFRTNDIIMIISVQDINELTWKKKQISGIYLIIIIIIGIGSYFIVH